MCLFLERREDREREGEKHASANQDLAHNPGMCPDRESNQ